MPKFRILHKGLVLVAVPLIAGIWFMVVLYQGILNTDRLIKHELLLKDAVISYVKATSSAAAAQAFLQFYNATHGEAYNKRYIKERDASVVAYSHLENLLQNEPIIVPSMAQATQYLIHGDPARSAPFLKALEKLADNETKNAMASLGALNVTLVIGLAICVFISVILAIFFCLNITELFSKVVF